MESFFRSFVIAITCLVVACGAQEDSSVSDENKTVSLVAMVDINAVEGISQRNGVQALSRAAIQSSLSAISKITLDVVLVADATQSLSVDLTENAGVYSAVFELLAEQQYQFTANAYIGEEITYTGTTFQAPTEGGAVNISLSHVDAGTNNVIPQINQIMRSELVEQGTSVNLSFTVTGAVGELLSYELTGDAGTFTPSSGDIQLPESSNSATVVVSYQAPIGNEAVEYEYTLKLTNSYNNSVITDFSINVAPALADNNVSVSFNPVIKGVTVQRNATQLTWALEVDAQAGEAYLQYAWSFESSVGSAQFSSTDTNPGVMDGYDETVVGSVAVTVTDTSANGGVTTYHYDLNAGDYPDALVAENGTVEGEGTPATYNFTSKVTVDSTSVSYFGQATRHLLINDLKALIGTADLYDVIQDAAGKAEVLERLNRIYAVGTSEAQGKLNLIDENVFDGDVEATPVSVSLEAPLVLTQTDYSDLSGDKNLQGKIAGQDNDLTNAFVGWDVTIIAAQTDNDRPDLLIQSWFDAIAVLATDGNDATTFVSAEGLDYQQLVQKLLLGAVTYSQAAEDYLKPSKGLLKQNSAGDKDGSKDYTGLEHQWDEAFGYFGAQRDYNLRTDSEVKATPYLDAGEDTSIDLYSEYSFGHSIALVKRDIGAIDASTDFSKAAMDAFLNGRQLIQDNFGTDPVEGSGYHTELLQFAETALNNWENAIAATVIHYINDVISETNSLGTNEPASFANLAKHWSEMKGFALSLQFSPIAQISTADLASVHDKMGQGPVLGAGDAAVAYVAKLAEARELLQAAYGFSATNVAGW